MFAATGDNFLIIDGNWIKVEPFSFTFVPWKKDASGKEVPDLENRFTKSYDALVQIGTGWVCETLSDDIRERIIAKKKELFGDGQLNNSPDTENQDELRDIRTLNNHTPPPPPPNIPTDNIPQ